MVAKLYFSREPLAKGRKDDRIRIAEPYRFGLKWEKVGKDYGVCLKRHASLVKLSDSCSPGFSSVTVSAKLLQLRCQLKM